jgi:RNA polymerase sigma factor (sigma-70 family)
MRDSTRAGRNAVFMGHEVLRLFENDRGAWYETPEEIEKGIEWGKRKAHLLRWVRKQMGRKLTPRERRCVELYFFEGLTYREVGQMTGTNASSAYRAVSRSIRKLKMQAREDAPHLKKMRGLR